MKKPLASSFLTRVVLLVLPLLLLAFTTGDSKSEYTLQPAAYSICTGDIDLDGDIDIITGHNYNMENDWSGLSYLSNDGLGYFSLLDTLYLFGWQPSVIIKNLDDNIIPEVIAKKEDPINEDELIAVILNNDVFDIHYFSLNTYEGVNIIETGNIDGANNDDLIFASNQGQFWGILYNDGTGNFSEPEYHYVSDYHPTNIDCGDLNGDGREDIVVCGQSTEVYFSYPGNFQKLTLESDYFKDDVSLSDFDQDGDLDIISFVDLYWVNYTSLKIYENLGNNNFDTLEVYEFQPACLEFFVTDLDNDSLPDIVFHTDDLTGTYIFYNQGVFSLSEPQFLDIPYYGEYTRKSHCDDLDGNGYNDIITVRYLYSPLSNNLSILFNDGNGNFQEDPITNITSNFDPQTSNLSCYPNPFKDNINIKFNIIEDSFAEISVYNMKGKLVNTICSKNLNKGNQLLTWDGRDKNGKEVKASTYLVCLNAGRQTETIQIIKLTD